MYNETLAEKLQQIQANLNALSLSVTNLVNNLQPKPESEEPQQEQESEPKSNTWQLDLVRTDPNFPAIAGIPVEFKISGVSGRWRVDFDDGSHANLTVGSSGTLEFSHVYEKAFRRVKVRAFAEVSTPQGVRRFGASPLSFEVLAFEPMQDTTTDTTPEEPTTQEPAETQEEALEAPEEQGAETTPEEPAEAQEEQGAEEPEQGAIAEEKTPEEPDTEEPEQEATPAEVPEWRRPRMEPPDCLYVSSSTGLDTNPGTQEAPLKTLSFARGRLERLRKKWLCVKAGDVFIEDVLGYWGISDGGITTYGGRERFRVLVGSHQQFINVHDQSGLDNVVFENFEIVAYKRVSAPVAVIDAAAFRYGIRMLFHGENVAISNVKITGFAVGISVEGKDNSRQETEAQRLDRERAGDHMIVGFRLTDSVINDTWAEGGHAQGVYLAGSDKHVFKRNVFVQCGDVPRIPQSRADQFRQGLYIYFTLNASGIVEDNVFVSCAAQALQSRPGGIIENNLFLDNPVAASVLDAESIIKGNVVVGARDIRNDTPNNGVGWGFNVESTESVEIVDNVFLNKVSTTSHGRAITVKQKDTLGGRDPWQDRIGNETMKVSIRGNTVRNWHTSGRFYPIQVEKSVRSPEGFPIEFYDNDMQQDKPGPTIEQYLEYAGIVQSANETPAEAFGKFAVENGWSHYKVHGARTWFIRETKAMAAAQKEAEGI